MTTEDLLAHVNHRATVTQWPCGRSVLRCEDCQQDIDVAVQEVLEPDAVAPDGARVHTGTLG